MTTNIHPAEALQHLLYTLEDKIEGQPDHPWIPGAGFHDGRIEDAMELAWEALQ